MNKKEIEEKLKEIGKESLREARRSSIKVKGMDDFEKGYRMALIDISKRLGVKGW